MVRLAVFDLDGTLVDSQRDLASAANALVRELGGVPLAQDTVAGMVGEGAAVLVHRVLTAAGLDPATPRALPRFVELYDERLTEHTLPYDGITEMLTALHGRLPLAVLTNKPQRAADRLLDNLGLARYFTAVLGGDTPLRRKPAPAGLVALCAQAKVTAAETLLVGDSPIDLVTARNAGTQILLVRYGFGFRFTPNELDALPIADSPAEILQYRP